MRFRFINYFKPLLDVYQAPYKNKCYFWVGLHLLIRTLFYALSALNESSNLTFGAVLLYLIGNFTGYLHPFRHFMQNCNELVLLFNLGVLYVTALSGKINIATIIMYVFAAAQFCFIVLYHMIKYSIGDPLKVNMQLHISTFARGVIKDKPCSYAITLINWISIRFNKISPDNSIKLQGSAFNIPDKTYDYSKYQEPLLGED